MPDHLASAAIARIPRLALIVPGDPDQRTGGYLYDARIVAGLRQMGSAVDVIGLVGEFPVADATARRSMLEALESIPDGQWVVIDGLALGGAPDSVAAHADRLALVGLVHHPLGDETGLSDDQRRRLLDSERAALSHCRSIVVTSRFTRRRLKELGLIDQQPVHVIEPGVDPAGLALRVEQRLNGKTPEEPARLLCVASLSPRKGQDLLIKALAGLRDQRWTLDLVGSMDRAPEFARDLRDGIRKSGLDSRVTLVGEVDAKALNALYEQADVCLLPSWYEGYGMVVSEALARGLPLITTTGGALADTVPAAAALRVPPGQIKDLREALMRWLSNPELRVELTRAAVDARSKLTDWPVAARQFASVLASNRSRVHE